jgi:hypothetical protein
MTDDIVTRLRARAASEAANESYFNSLLFKVGLKEYMINSLSYEAADEIERLRKEVSKWATTPPNRMVCVTHGEMFMCFDDYMGGVYWCEGCRNE